MAAKSIEKKQRMKLKLSVQICSHGSRQQGGCQALEIHQHMLFWRFCAFWIVPQISYGISTFPLESAALSRHVDVTINAYTECTLRKLHHLPPEKPDSASFGAIFEVAVWPVLCLLMARFHR